MSDLPDEIFAKIRTAITDPQKIRRNDPGHPDVCNVYAYHKKFNPAEEPQIREDCISGELGCVACKKNCADKIAGYFEPHREKRAYYESHPQEVNEIVSNGIKMAKQEAEKTMDAVHTAMKMG